MLYCDFYFKLFLKKNQQENITDFFLICLKVVQLNLGLHQYHCLLQSAV